jgi:hypothetical protein
MGATRVPAGDGMLACSGPQWYVVIAMKKDRHELACRSSFLREGKCDYPALRTPMPAARARVSALSVFSQEKLPSFSGMRPKWPWRAVVL